jgi:hypothetical protein
MPKISSLMDLVNGNPDGGPPPPPISSMDGLKLERRVLDKILYEVDDRDILQ